MRYFVFLGCFVFFVMAKAQFADYDCYQSMVPVAIQPPDSGFSDGSREVPHQNLYRIYSVSVKLPNGDYTRRVKFYKFNGVKWDALPDLSLSNVSISNTHTFEFKGDLYYSSFVPYGAGRKAPAGKLFTLFKLKNGVWDTATGGTIDTASFHFGGGQSEVAATNMAIYRAITSWKDSVYIQRFNTATKKWKLITVAFCPRPTPFHFIMGKNRIVVGGITSANGQTVNRGIWIDSNDNINAFQINKNLYGYYFGIDLRTDKIYFYNPFNDTNVYEYTTKISAIRSTQLNFKSTGVSTSYGRLTVYNGAIGWNLEDYTLYGVNHHFYLCKDGTKWQDFQSPRPKGIIDKMAQFRMARGVFYCNRLNDRILYQLQSGTPLTGFVYADADSNCSYNDSIDHLVYYTGIKLKESSFVNGYNSFCQSNGQGEYEIAAPSGDFEISANESKYGFSSCFSHKIQIIQDSAMEVNVPLKMADQTDLAVQVESGFRLRSLEDFSAIATAFNFGKPCDSAEIIVQLPPNVTGISDDHWHFDSATNSLIFGIKNFFSGKIIKLEFKTRVNYDSIKVGDYLCFSVRIRSNCFELDSTDNHFKWCVKVVYSYDPNHKDVSETQIPVGAANRLQYFIEFENTGTDYAGDIVLVDTLPQELNPETIKFIGATHTFTAIISGNVLTMTFKNINLMPKSTHPNACTGNISFSLNVRPNSKQGDIIANRAYIYFDANEPVITAYANTLVSDYKMSVKTNGKLAPILVYPNPSNGIINFLNQSLATQTLTISDLTGRKITQLALSPNNITNLQTQNWPKGIYLVQCQGFSEKLVVE